MSCRPFEIPDCCHLRRRGDAEVCAWADLFLEKSDGWDKVTFFIITTTTASFVPNVFFTTGYQELAPDSSKITIMMMMMIKIIIKIRRVRVARNKQKKVSRIIG